MLAEAPACRSEARGPGNAIKNRETADLLKGAPKGFAMNLPPKLQNL
jgi:hypothetical protein